ncbi:MAG: hypothetical protein ACTTJC_00400 [Campylobacter sp.]
MLIAIAGLGGYYYFLSNVKNSSQTEEPKEVAVTMLSFDELPKAEREKYIKKDHIDSYGNYLSPKSYAENFDIDGFDDPISNDLNELKTQIRTIRAQNKLLYNDNVDLVAKNLEIVQLLNEQKELNKAQKKEFENKNMEFSKNNSDQILTIQNELEKSKQEAIQDLAKAKTEFLNSEQKYNEQLNLAQKSIKELEKELENIKKTSDENLILLKNENEKLKSDHDLKESEIKRMTVENSAEILRLKNNYEDSLNELKKQNDKQKFEYENELNLKQNEYEKLKNEREDRSEKLSIELKSTKENLEKIQKQNEILTKQNEYSNTKINELNLTSQNLKDDLQRQRDSFQKDVSRTWKLYQNDVAKLKTQIDKANTQLSQNQSEFKSKIDALQNEKDLSANALKASEDNLSKISTQLEKTTKLLEIQNEENKKNMQNYKILNDKIVLLTTSNITLSKEFQSRISKLQKELSEAQKNAYELNITLGKKDELLRTWSDKFEKLKQESANLIQGEKDKLSWLEKQNKELDKYAKIGKTNTGIKGELDITKKQLTDIMNEIEYFENENENLKKIIELNFKSEVPKKLVLISSIECNDMVINSNEPTSICRHRVAEFLQRYNSNYIFEVTPIVSRANFLATSKIAQNLSKDEIEKINSYANYGVGKERAKVAGQLIKDEFGDFSRISYGNDIIISQNKQGFIIKVYR